MFKTEEKMQFVKKVSVDLQPIPDHDRDILTTILSQFMPQQCRKGEFFVFGSRTQEKNTISPILLIGTYLKDLLLHTSSNMDIKTMHFLIYSNSYPSVQNKLEMIKKLLHKNLKAEFLTEKKGENFREFSFLLGKTENFLINFSFISEKKLTVYTQSYLDFTYESVFLDFAPLYTSQQPIVYALESSIPDIFSKK